MISVRKTCYNVGKGSGKIMFESEIVIDYQYKGISPMQFGRENCAPGHFFGPSVRTHWLLHYVVSGFGKFEREGETYHSAAS